MESDSACKSESESKSETESESELSWQTAGGNSQAKDCVFGIGIYGGARWEEGGGKGAGFVSLTLHLKQRSRT